MKVSCAQWPSEMPVPEMDQELHPLVSWEDGEYVAYPDYFSVLPRGK